MTGQNGTSSTPICDLIEQILSHDLSRGTLEMALRAARPIEASMGVERARKTASAEVKREKERIRKAVYRSNLSRAPEVGQRGTESLSLKDSNTVDSIKKTDSPRPAVPRDKPQDDWPADYQDQFWETYPRREGKKSALAKLDAIRKSGKVLWVALMAGVKRYAVHKAGTEQRYIKQPATWLNGGCWDDEYAASLPLNGGSRHEANRNGGGRDGLSVVNARLRRSISERTAGETAAGAAPTSHESGYGYHDAASVVVGMDGAR